MINDVPDHIDYFVLESFLLPRVAEARSRLRRCETSLGLTSRVRYQQGSPR